MKIKFSFDVDIKPEKFCSNNTTGQIIHHYKSQNCEVFHIG